MAFTGSAVVKLVSEKKVRITGLSLASAAAGTISCHGGTGAVKLPSQFQPEVYAIGSDDVALVDSVECRWEPAAAVATAIPIECVKTGTTLADFLITLTNTHGSIASPALEITVTFK